MSTYVLIHGAWHGGWCWSRVAPMLRQKGHTVLAPDLPGHGEDKTPVAQITLQTYVDSVAALLDRQAEPVILVGHSMGGLVISQVAESRSEKIRKLVYVCAFLLRDGETLGAIAERDSDALVMPNLVVTEDQVSARLNEDMITQAFYSECTPEDAMAAQSKLVSQALAPFMTPLQLTDDKFGRLPRVYIECTRDRAISITIQREMYKNSACSEIHTLNTDHSPFLSTPRELTSLLESLDGS